MCFSADYGYVSYLATAIKSLLWNNDHVMIYVMNSDIPQEWFRVINNQISCIGNQVLDIKVNPKLLAGAHGNKEHLTAISFAFLFASEYIDDDQFVVLDADLIVDGSLDRLFDYQFANGIYYAGVRDIFGDGKYLNSGVLVVNNRALQGLPNLHDHLLVACSSADLTNGDQTVVNDFYRGHLALLPEEYNYQVGAETTGQYNSDSRVIKRLNRQKSGRIYHYVTADKPWHFASAVRYRDCWWHYFGLGWSDIVHHYLTRLRPAQQGKRLFTFTGSQDLECLEQLVKLLPDYEFDIVSWTDMGWKLRRMVQYPNVHLTEVTTRHRTDKLIAASSAYLDINRGPKWEPAIRQFAAVQPGPIYTFADVSSNCADFQDRYLTFTPGAANLMAEAIRRRFDEK